jgi:hypothetical protein
MSKLIIAIGPARSGKTVSGTRWLKEGDKRRMFDYTQSEAKNIVSSLEEGFDVWVNVNTPDIKLPLHMITLTPGVHVEVHRYRSE